MPCRMPRAVTVPPGDTPAHAVHRLAPHRPRSAVSPDLDVPLVKGASASHTSPGLNVPLGDTCIHIVRQPAPPVPCRMPRATRSAPSVQGRTPRS